MALLLWLVPAEAGPSQGREPEQRGAEDAVYVYSVFRGASGCAEVVERLENLPLRPTVILSVEQSRAFVLDGADGESLLACVLERLRASSRTVKALLLQDPSYVERSEEAVRRASLLADFAARHPGLLAGAQVDVEPYATERWSCGSREERRGIMRDLHRLLGQVREKLRGLPLGMVGPWWYPRAARELPETAPEALFGVADEIYLMAYGDEGGPLVGGTAARVLARVDAPEFFTGRGRLHIALATYEFRSPAQFQEEVEKVRVRLAARPNFAGTAVFHAGSQFDVPLVRRVSGTVTDQAGRGLPGVELEAAGILGQSRSCGRFSLRGFPEASALLIVRKPGFRSRELPLQLGAPGTNRELGNVALEKEP